MSIPMAWCYWISCSPKRPHVHFHTSGTVFCVDAVEVGFTESAYTTSESDGSVMVCVEVKSGQLAPAELAPLTLTTSPGTALGTILHHLYYTSYENINPSFVCDFLM